MYAPSLATRLLGAALIAGFAITPAAAEITGTIASSITLEKGCLINGTNTRDTVSAGEMGRLEFGSHTTLFTSANSEVLNSANPITIQCTPGAAPTVKFGAGQNAANAGSNSRAMKLSVGPTDYFVGYNLYSNSGRTTSIAADGSIPLNTDGTAKDINVWATAFGGAALIDGTYVDTITVTITM